MAAVAYLDMISPTCVLVVRCLHWALRPCGLDVCETREQGVDQHAAVQWPRGRATDRRREATFGPQRCFSSETREGRADSPSPARSKETRVGRSFASTAGIRFLRAHRCDLSEDVSIVQLAAGNDAVWGDSRSAFFVRRAGLIRTVTRARRVFRRWHIMRVWPRLRVQPTVSVIRGTDIASRWESRCASTHMRTLPLRERLRSHRQPPRPR